MQSLPALIAVVGPTGSGKSELGLAMAEAMNGEIVNCDSVQVYRYLDIGAAKTPVSERRGIPHHLIDIANPDELITAGDYAARTRPVLHNVAGRGRLPVVVGGTGFYLRALIDGLFIGPSRDDALRTRLTMRAERKPGSLHRILSRLDPPTARRIHPNDTKKLIRALEVCLLTRQPMSDLHSQGRDSLDGFRVLKYGLDPPRDELYLRIELRARQMFETGLLQEVAHVLQLGFPADSKSLTSLGYRQAVQVLQGQITVENAIALTQRETRQYAKRQRTWFRREPDIEWLRGFGSDPQVQSDAIRRATAFIHQPNETFLESARI